MKRIIFLCSIFLLIVLMIGCSGGLGISADDIKDSSATESAAESTTESTETNGNTTDGPVVQRGIYILILISAVILLVQILTAINISKIKKIANQKMRNQ